MSVESLHQDFIERNGGLGVFKWIIEQDGFINPSKENYILLLLGMNITILM